MGRTSRNAAFISQILLQSKCSLLSLILIGLKSVDHPFSSLLENKHSSIQYPKRHKAVLGVSQCNRSNSEYRMNAIPCCTFDVMI